MKIKTFVTLFIILLIIFLSNFIRKTSYNALEITDECKIGIDLNRNGAISEEEFFEIKDITPLCTPESFKNQNYAPFTENEQIYITQKTVNLYRKLFLNSIIRIDDNDISTNFQNAAELILKEGLATTNSAKYKEFENPDKIKEYKSQGTNKTFYLLNTKSNKYHKIDCIYGLQSSHKKFIDKELLPTKAKPCKYCLSPNKPKHESKYFSKNNKLTETVSRQGNIEIINTIGAEVFKPSSKCNNKMCLSLKNEINNAKSTIDMAVYDISNQPEIINALIKAKQRGVKIRIATDKSYDAKKKDILPVSKQFASFIIDDSKPKKDSRRLMHNKFFIFDNEKVWTGSANITDTGLSGFNTNSVILINSKEIAQIFTNEFNNFANQKFHSAKSKTNIKTITLNNSKVTVYFSPQDTPIDTAIIPCIKNAKESICVPSFIITHRGFAEELVKAKKRGADVKVIIDATSARNKYSTHTYMRNNGIEVKTENFAGKVHTKSVIIDDKIVFIGSMNFTKSGNVYNDENCIKIENPQIARYMKNDFYKIWNKIPNKYLQKDPAPESYDSVGSCFDGVDNDFDGLIDMNDSGCKIKK